INVSEHAFFIDAIKLLVEKEIDLIAVVNDEMELEGVLSDKVLLKQLAIFTGIEEPGGMIVLEIEKANYAFGEISRLVETN
ncbi:hypothetical protein ABTM51_21185, partial [Acinetobacter baumannii]